MSLTGRIVASTTALALTLCGGAVACNAVTRDEPRPSPVVVPSTTTPEAEPSTARPTPSTTEQLYEPEVVYPDCAAVRDADADPISLGQPGYSPKLDPDGDGVACD